MTANEQVERVSLALHQTLASNWMSVASALDPDAQGGQYGMLLGDLSRAAIAAMQDRALPVVAHKGPYDTDASIFAEVAARLERGLDVVGGSNVTDAVVRLIRRELDIIDSHEAKS